MPASSPGRSIPVGAPLWLYPLLVPIEFISNIIIRPITLTIRLWANFLAGHFGYPVPDTTDLLVFADGNSYAERRAVVDRLALVLDVTPADNLGHYSAGRDFGPIRYRDPFSGAEKTYSPPGGGPGYYRVPTLISIWATAPFLHNNALGTLNNDPSVKGRLESFEDSISRLLSPERRRTPPRRTGWPPFPRSW